GALRGLSLALGGWLPLVTVLAAAPWLVRHGVRAGAVLGAVVYVTQALQPALHTLVEGVAGGGLRLTVTLGRLLETGTPPAVPAPSTVDRPEGGGLVLRGVTFRYGPHAQPVVDRLDLAVPEGGHLVIAGASGIGKSTLAALMSGLLPPDAGEVLLGGVPAGALPAPVLAAHRVLIPQEAYVFTGTLRDNLAYLRPGVPAGELDAAVAALGARELVDRLGGYGSVVEPGALSAGERQLLALVRAYLSPARLVILDEAGCHLDPAAEARVERAFAARPGSLVVIAHRISSARRAGRVLLLDGVRPELGSHAELIRRCPGYRELVGHWDGSEPAGLLGDVHGLDAGTGAGLGDDAGQVVAHRTRG
ncbi:MAG TPA: ABC transporter ATP-binding protein, partial [Rugosimonospora sp.]|nr:ABC transporter ATP-binding protein [Rugosimonospora sp.]